MRGYNSPPIVLLLGDQSRASGCFSGLVLLLYWPQCFFMCCTKHAIITRSLPHSHSLPSLQLIRSFLPTVMRCCLKSTYMQMFPLPLCCVCVCVCVCFWLVYGFWELVSTWVSIGGYTVCLCLMCVSPRVGVRDCVPLPSVVVDTAKKADSALIDVRACVCVCVCVCGGVLAEGLSPALTHSTPEEGW